MSRSYMGDAIVYEGGTFSSKVIQFVGGGGKITHCGFRLDEDTAESIEWDLVKRESRILVHDLTNPFEDYLSYEIYEPKEITPLQREGLRYLNETVGRTYDPGLIVELAKRKILKRHHSVEDLAKENLFTCSSRMAALYGMVGIEVISDIHFSQIEPKHFAESVNFKKIGEWFREIERDSESTIEKFKNILPSYKSPLRTIQKK